MLTHETLADAMTRTTQSARACGALEPIATSVHRMPDGGIDFIVRRVVRSAKPRSDRTGGAGETNPFLPYDPALCVGDLSETHVALLNKYNVIDDHLLIVTRAFAPQTSALDQADFSAVGTCLAALDGLAFYNSGQLAGASQPHKHLQLVPATGDASALPMEPILNAAPLTESEPVSLDLPFRNGAIRCPAIHAAHADARAWGAAARVRYQALLDACGVDGRGAEIGAPYNLLMTRRWMMLVPRSRERFNSISLNAVAFAGALLVHGDDQWRHLERHGPLAALSAVGFPR